MKSKAEIIASERDPRFDTMRGLLLICMTVNHLPTELRCLTDQSLGVFSAAEGFVFLSGLMAGLVYTRRLRQAGPSGLMSAALGRAKKIYAWHAASFAGALACVLLTEFACGYCSPNAPRLFFEHPVAALGLGASLLYQPGLLDLLPMYCVFVLLLPAVIGGLESGRRPLVFAASAAVWLAAQLLPPVEGLRAYPLNLGSFNLLAWQFLFVAGVAVGHARASGQAQLARPSLWAVAFAASVAAYGFGIRHAGWPSLWPDAAFGILLNKPALGLLRVADFGCVAYLVAVVGARFPGALTARPLALLGRHSLFLVAAQSVAITALLQFPGLFASAAARTLVAVATVAFLFAAAAAKRALDQPVPQDLPLPSQSVFASRPTAS
ncbi:MAG TPA: OpgC domain-containing protein [Opitutaceae bacterium]|nr:OpgC domain-containing protein [Opitutaceae bacterium]